MKNKINKMKGFTLVELLIVIALISILSVAVLATINPIEQSNKAKDSTKQNDAAEIMNAYERFYANSQSYPWMVYGAVKPTVEDSILLRSDNYGFGICTAPVDLGTEPTATVAECSTTAATPGLLISKDELKTAFVGKDSFEQVRDGTHPENALWLYKDAGSGGSIYVCYIPKAKSNRDVATNSLFCLTDTPTRIEQDGVNCVAPTTTGDAAWGLPDAAITAGNIAIFKCVP